MSLRIYFCGSIRGGRQDVEIYSRIIGYLRKFGKVLTEHIGNPMLNEKGEDAVKTGDKYIHDRDLEWLQEADVIVAEVTQPSLGVGYEIGRAMAMNKKILCLFRTSAKHGCGRLWQDHIYSPICKES
ncbi:5-hydroxymethyl-dUMP N-hydrolase isoform X3 [Heptranchias perlo]|uniref:5-hydroxymethyl-dUMP N-hydrolase isoform X3 n=1 Tax=Heptranchias perlo TaxID=212740 RepID=UPI00355989B5